jgi:ABC-type multidrug transport system ATPase subunit
MNGIDSSISESYIESVLNAYGILAFKSYPCGNLSGGTKRKVSAAIATMLPRKLVVLDEASTGLDPLARQKLWSTVLLLNHNRTSIMTTHYINETSVCDRIAIMTEGKLKCVDTEYNLTKSIEDGYVVSLKFSAMIPDFMEFAQSNLFPDNVANFSLDTIVGDTVICNFKGLQISLGELIKRLVSLKTRNLIQDFSISRKSLDDVFLDMVKSGPNESA